MRIACLQFAPQVGDVDNNLNRADAVLSRANPKDLDLLVLPELCFTGYNFRSLQHISPFLEPAAAGITSLWARTTALKYNCFVTAGYPEKVDVSPKWPAGPEYYNSAITVNPDGETVANYRKSFLYYTDETWALEGSGFYSGTIDDLGNVAMGICMDLNPYKFEAPWNAWEFAYHILHRESNLVVLSMAWLTREDITTFSRAPQEPDMETLSYWLSRLEPVIRAETIGEIIVVIANRCGSEEEVVYAGTSTVLGINQGEVNVYGILGRGEKELLVVDTSIRPQARLISEPSSAATDTSIQSKNTEASPSTALTTPDLDNGMSESNDGHPAVSPNYPKYPPAFSSSESDNEGDYRSPTYLARGEPVQPPATSTPSISPSLMNHQPSPNSGNYSHAQNRAVEEPALISPDRVAKPTLVTQGFAQEPQANLPPPDHHPTSASAVPDKYQSEFTARTFGRRSDHISPRPRSSFW
ncbi:uncharacterized protein BP5553_07148 [Venustampulla echinocandica]|uniref:CN hydrolase domain-containing protein n=1 Tax=Venustampulla echinocandica TaxID=2656787 RepID=A0A370TIP0_9HELO|nr:uncharacterized protein BP5553_07148 [Venustampulla echinocandica]RDL35217.1 hypothetical protein BP5553_07148 [Venustampulla echinocandica]